MRVVAVIALRWVGYETLQRHVIETCIKNFVEALGLMIRGLSSCVVRFSDGLHNRGKAGRAKILLR